MTTAVVFGYGDIGIRCTQVLRRHCVDVKLVVTHADAESEGRWYGSLSDFASRCGFPVATPAQLDHELLHQLHDLAPDFVFSFYYRQLIPTHFLATARRGALNLHGSLLPRLRGRAPINWAVLKGLRETGATLHYMVARADAGDIVDQAPVPIADDDAAYDVFLKVASAAELILSRSLPALEAGVAPRKPQILSQGEYRGRRRPEDGRIDWSLPARDIHNLVRAVAPPFPGAFADFDGERWTVTRTRVMPIVADAGKPRTLAVVHGKCAITCDDRQQLELIEARDKNGPVNMRQLLDRLLDRTMIVS